MTAILIGGLFILLGLWGIARWFSDVLAVLRGMIPLSLLVGGIVALASGISTFRLGRKDDGEK